MNTIFSRFKVILDMCATYCKAMLLIKLNHEKTSVLIFTKLNDVKKSQNHRFSFMRSFISFFWLQSIKEISQEKILVRNNKYNKKCKILLVILLLTTTILLGPPSDKKKLN